MKEITFIHAADLHLDSPFAGLSTAPEAIFQEIKESTFKALNNLVKLAIEREVNFILLVGDLFDHEIQSLKAQIRLRAAFEKLAEHNIEVYLSYGNHDYMAGNIHSVAFPDNVHVFPTEEVSHFTYKNLANIYGFSYVEKIIDQNKAKDYQVKDQDLPFHIATLHGSIKSNTEHDLYAPFKLSDLSQKPFDYWALGHIHKREILHKEPAIVYPGNTQGRHRKESGEKGCYYVKMKVGETKLEFVPLQAISFEKISLNLANYKDLYESKTSLLQKLQDLRLDTPLLIDLKIKNSESLSLHHPEDLEDFLHLVHEKTIEQSQWKYIYRTELEEELAEVSTVGEHFISELMKESKDFSLEKSIQGLLNHRLGRKYLEAFSEEEKEKLKDQALQKILQGLLQKG